MGDRIYNNTEKFRFARNLLHGLIKVVYCTVDSDFDFAQSTIIRELSVAETHPSRYFLSQKYPKMLCLVVFVIDSLLHKIALGVIVLGIIRITLFVGILWRLVKFFSFYIYICNPSF